jgi:uncharacterized protein (UPF0335 family)
MARRSSGPHKSTSTMRGPKRAAPKKVAAVKRVSKSRDATLESITQRICNLVKQRLALGADIADIYAQAKDQNYDTKVLRRAVKILVETSEARSERIRVEEGADEMLLGLGHLADTPLGVAARSAAEGRSPPPMPVPEPADEFETAHHSIQ